MDDAVFQLDFQTAALRSKIQAVAGKFHGMRLTPGPPSHLTTHDGTGGGDSTRNSNDIDNYTRVRDNDNNNGTHGCGDGLSLVPRDSPVTYVQPSQKQLRKPHRAHLQQQARGRRRALTQVGIRA